MNVRRLLQVCILIGLVLPIFGCVTATAEPKMMADGELFDGQFYAQQYPDVARVYGTDDAALYSHYVDYGKAEGRLPYKKESAPKKVLPKTIDFGNKCILIIGDSRAVSLSRTLNDYLGYTLMYAQPDGQVTEVILQKGKSVIAICAEGGGSYKKGSFNRAVAGMNNLLLSNELLQNRNGYYYIDMFGVNDINESPTAPVTYMKKDVEIAKNIPGIIMMYHLNAGPITEDGYFYQEKDLSNEEIAEYNTQFETNENVQVVDLFSYLMMNGFDTVYDAENNHPKTGMHYDVSTDIEIIELIRSLVN